MTQPPSKRLVRESDLTDPNTPAGASLNARYGSLAWQQRIASKNSLALLHFKYALGNRSAAPCDIMVHGDSVTDGWYTTLAERAWPNRLRDALRLRYPTPGVTGGRGFISMRVKTNYLAVPFADWPVTFSGGANGSDPAFGLDHQSRTMSAAGHTITVTFTGTGLDIDYTKYSSGGTFSWAIDAGAATNVSTSQAGATDTGTGIVQIRGLAASAHTLVITNVSGTTFINGCFAYNGDEAAGIRMTALSRPGRQTLSAWPADATKRYWVPQIPKRTPDLVVFAYGLNDYAAASVVPVSNFKSNLQEMIAAHKSNVSGYVPSFLLLPLWQITTQGSPSESWADYVNAMYEVAEEDPDSAVAIVDMQQRVKTGPPSGNTEFLPDGTHINDASSMAFAEMVLESLAVG